MAAMVATGLGILALNLDHRWLLLVAAPVFGVGYGCCLVSGLRETERLAPSDQRGATVAIFYALTYLGFAAPYLLGGLAGLGIGDQGALALTIGAAAASLAIVSTYREPSGPEAGAH